MGNLVLGIAFVFKSVLTIYFWIVIISALLSWVNPDPYNPIVRTLKNLTEPVYYRLRRTFPFLIVGGIDLSPIVILIGIQFLQIVVVGSLYELAAGMKMGMGM